MHPSRGHTLPPRPLLPPTVLRSYIKDKSHIFVQYQTLTAHSGGLNPLKKIVQLANVRPTPPRELHRPSKSAMTCDHFDLRVHREWDDGSWVLPVPVEQRASGVVKCRKIRIQIRDKKETMGADSAGSVEDDQEFESEQCNLRFHREWGNQSSAPPLSEHQTSSEVRKCRKIRFKVKDKKEGARRNFDIGTLVEVSSDEEGYKGAWYSARISDYIGKDKFLVEYVSLVTDDKTQLLREEALSDYIRPCPPLLPPVVQFKVFQKVDAWYNDGWWEGAVSKVLTASKYIMYFSSTNEDLEFKHSNLRLHQDWRNGHWVMDPCQDFYGF